MKTTCSPEFPQPTLIEHAPPGRPAAADAAPGGNGDGSLQAPLAEVLRICLEHLRDAQAWRLKVNRTLETTASVTLANTERLQAISKTLTQIEAEQELLSNGPEAGDPSRVELLLGQLTRNQAAHQHNLEQVRVLTEALSRRFEELSQDVILRQVKDPLFVSLARLYEAVYELIGQRALSDVHLEPIRQRIRSLLEDHHVQLIHPDDGVPLDPRQHQPVKQVRTSNPALQGRIATTYNVGLVHGQRLVQPARVAVFALAAS